MDNPHKDNPIPWPEIRQEYLTGNTMSALGRKYGVDKSAICRRAQREGWSEERQRLEREINEAASARVREAAIEDRVMLYDATREAAANIIKQLLEASRDPLMMRRHLVQHEYSEFDCETKVKTIEKFAEDKIADTINGRNAADIARAIKDFSGIARILDGFIEAPDQAKLAIEREKLDLSKRQAGMGDDIESESGIALLPAVDESLLDKALPDPDQGEKLG